MLYTNYRIKIPRFSLLTNAYKPIIEMKFVSKTVKTIITDDFLGEDW